MLPETPHPEKGRLALVSAFVSQGVRLLQRENYKESIQYFKNRHIAQIVGVDLDEAPRFFILTKPIVQRKHIVTLVHVCALNSYFDFGIKGNENKPYMTIGDIDIPDHVRTQMNPIFIKLIEQNIALLHAEEWLHVMQWIGGSLTGQTDKEVDVALYLKQHGVQLTDEFLDRQNRRDYFK